MLVNKSISLSALAFQRQFDRFAEKVRANSGKEFTSFRDGLPAEWEEYKDDVRREALRRLAFPKWKESDVGTGRILDRVIKAIEINYAQPKLRNNLVAWQARWGPKGLAHRPLLAATADAISREAFERWFLDFYQDRITPPAGFEEFRKLAGNRYDLVAYLFFLKDWNRFLPIAPTIFDKAFAMLGLELATARKCSWENYEQYNAAIGEVQKLLQEVAQVSDARLIDAHSFCWMLVKMEMPAEPPPKKITAPQPVTGLKAATQAEPSADKTEFDTMSDEDFAKRDAVRRSLGRIAQDIAFESERIRLEEIGHADVTNAVETVWDQPARGYDILSCELDGAPRYIEVKAARRSGNKLSFFLSRNEWRKCRELPNYHFYLVLDAKSNTPTVLMVESGSVSDECLAPVNYLAGLTGFSG